MKKILLLVCFTLLIACSIGDDNEKLMHKHYCNMVDLWHRTSHLPPDQRLGWPPYKGECRSQIKRL